MLFLKVYVIYFINFTSYKQNLLLDFYLLKIIFYAYFYKKYNNKQQFKIFLLFIKNTYIKKF